MQQTNSQSIAQRQNTVVVEIASAFVDERNGGNNAGLVFDRPELSEREKQSIAGLVGLPETAFVTETAGGYAFEFFTPTRRIADCGHATIAAFALLRERGRVAGDSSIKELASGQRLITFDGDVPFMQQRSPNYADYANVESLEKSLGITRDLLSRAPTIARHDVGFLLVPLRSAEMLADLKPNFELIRSISEVIDLVGFYAFARSGAREFDATARMFAPAYGIPEESATGMAAGLLAGYLRDCENVAGETLTVEQGMYMKPPSPSRIEARFSSNGARTEDIWVGGRGRSVCTMELRIA